MSEIQVVLVCLVDEHIHCHQTRFSLTSKNVVLLWMHGSCCLTIRIFFNGKLVAERNLSCFLTCARLFGELAGI